MISTLERTFLFNWRALGGPALKAEYRFNDRRKWRFDFACPTHRLAVEVEGGQWTGGRHTRGGGFQADCEKYNAATLAGWRVFRFTGPMLKRPVTHLGPLIQWIDAQARLRDEGEFPAPANLCLNCGTGLKIA